MSTNPYNNNSGQMKLILYLSTIITLLYLPEPISSSIAKHSHNTAESEFPS